MIVYWIAVAVKTVFGVVAALLKSLFPALWSGFAEGLSTMVATPGGAFALTVLDKACGLVYLMAMTGTVISIYLTVRMIRFVLGVVSKA